MPHRALRFPGLVVSALALVGLCTGCGGSDPTDAMNDGSSGSTGDTGGGAPATTMPGTATSATTTGSPGDDTGSTTQVPMGDTSGDSSTDGGFIPTPDMGTSKGTPLGEPCEADGDCASGSCFMFPNIEFGLCSECALDSDCMVDGGPGTCSLAQGWAVCTGGEMGAMCQSSEGCAADLVCAPIIEANPFQFCSECATEAECDEGDACAPGNMGNYCASPGSIVDHAPCPEAGGAYCMSTHCTEALYDGMSIGLYVCGECTVDTDCEEGQTCTPAFVTDMDLSGSVCS